MPPLLTKSSKLAAALGLKNLYITFNGYYPKIGAHMSTCSFKETEALSVCGRLGEDHAHKVLVVASAGNTARAFARVCSDNRIPLLLSVPEDNLDALWFDAPLNDCVKLIAARKGGDYFDAIHLSNLVLKSDKFLAEGECQRTSHAATAWQRPYFRPRPSSAAFRIITSRRSAAAQGLLRHGKRINA